MSDDRELLMKAAKAARINVDCWDEDPFDPEYSHNHKPAIRTADFPRWWWNPLLDDGDEARLEAELGLNVKWFASCVLVEQYLGSHGEWYADHGGDRQAARRMAGVRAAAEIGEAVLP